MSLSTLILRRLPVEGWLGPAERPVSLRLDLELTLGSPRTQRRGRPEDALDSDEVARVVRDVARRSRAGVLEPLLCELAATLLRRFPLRAVQVEGTKPAQPGEPFELAVRVQLDAAGLAELDRLDAAERLDD